MNWHQMFCIASAVVVSVAPAYAQEWWTVHNTPNRITGIVQDGQSLFCATTGGLAVSRAWTSGAASIAPGSNPLRS